MQAPTKVRAGIIGAALAFFLLVQWLAVYPDLIERFYSNGLYPLLTLVVTGITGQFPFSITEFSVGFCLLVLAPVYISRIIRGKVKFTRALLNLTVFFSLFIVWFYLSWGLNYLRVPLTKKLKLNKVQLEMDSFDSTFAELVKQTNALNLLYTVRTVDEINDIIENSYSEVLDSLGLATVPGAKAIKTLTNNWVLNKTTTSGFFSPFFHEVHYNNEMLVIEMPFTIAHEKAHQMGYTNEAEANFLAHLVCINAEDALVKYSGYFSVLGYFFGSPSAKREAPEFQLTEGVQLDFKVLSDRWRGHRGVISEFSSASYELYLKANRVKEGRKNYGAVVDLIIKHYAKNQQKLTE